MHTEMELRSLKRRERETFASSGGGGQALLSLVILGPTRMVAGCVCGAQMRGREGFLRMHSSVQLMITYKLYVCVRVPSSERWVLGPDFSVLCVLLCWL